MARAKKPATSKQTTAPKTKSRSKAKAAVVEPILLGATGLRQSTFPIALAVSPDGARIATGDWDGVVRVFDGATNACVFEAKYVARNHRGRHGIQRLLFSPDGSVLAALTGIGGHGNLCVAHLPSQVTWFETAAEYEAIAFSPDGAALAAITRGGVQIVNGRDGTPSHEIALPQGCHAKDVVVWSPDGELLVVKCYEQDRQRAATVAVIDAETYELRARHDVEIDLQRAELAFGRDGRVFAVAEVSAHDANRRDVRIVELDPRTGERNLRAVTGELGTTAWTPKLVPGIRAAVLDGQRGEEPIVVGVDRAAIVQTLPVDANRVAASADGSVIVVARGVALQLLDGDWQPRSTAPGLTSKVTAIACDGDSVTTCDATGVRVWGMDGTQRASYELGEAVDLVDGSALFVNEGRTVLVDLASRQPRGAGIDHAWRHGAVSRDGRLIAVRNYEDGRGSVQVWSLETGAQVCATETFGSSIYGIAFSPDGTQVAAGSWDGDIRIYDARTAERRVYTGKRGAYGLTAFSFSPDGTQLASGDHGRTVRLWKLPSGELRKEMRHQRKYIHATVFSPDGKLLAACDEASVRLWDTRTGEARGVARAGANCIAFSPDGTKLVAGGDGAAWIFDVASLQRGK